MKKNEKEKKKNEKKKNMKKKRSKSKRWRKKRKKIRSGSKDKEKDRKENRNKKVGVKVKDEEKRKRKLRNVYLCKNFSKSWAWQVLNRQAKLITIFFQDLKLSSSYNLGYSKHTFLCIKWSNSTCYNDKFLPICQI